MEAQTSCDILKTVPSIARGLKILLVDHDITSLMYVASMLEEYSYKVTTTELAAVALSMIWEEKDRFRLIMVNGNMPDMGIFTFIKSVMEIKDMPIILMASDTETEMATKALREGACFYLEKPIYMAKLKYLWQHVYRRRSLPTDGVKVDRAGVAMGNNLCGLINENENENADPKGLKKLINGEADLMERIHIGKYSENSSTKKLMIEGNKEQGKIKRNYLYEDKEGKGKGKRIETSSKLKGANSIDNSTPNKKQCLEWDEHLQLKFTRAICALGSENAHPKQILHMMNVPGLTLTQVSSHLQKYKAHVQRLLETAEANAPLVQRSVPTLAADFYTRTELAQLQGNHVSLERLQTSQTSENGGHQVPSTSSFTSPGFRTINRYQMEKQAFGLGRNVVQTSHDQLEKLGLSGISPDQESPIYTAFPDAPPDTRQELNPALDLPASFSLKNLVQNPMSFNGFIQHPDFLPKLISAFNLQNPDSFAAGYVDVNQRLDAVPRLAPPGYSLFRNSHPTDCGPSNGIQEEVPVDYSLDLRKSFADPVEVLKELENDEDHGNIPNPIDLERYYDWLSEALHENNSNLK